MSDHPPSSPQPAPGRLADWLAALRVPWGASRRDSALTRTLIVHAGGAKAGSSALQAFLAREADQLRRHDISYRAKAAVTRINEITSGNGEQFYGLFYSGRATDDSCAAQIESYFDGTGTAICSSEMLSLLDVKAWRRIRDACMRHGIRPGVLFFVRDVAPYLRSSYHQAIKRGGYHDSYEAFLSASCYDHAVALRTLRQVFRADEIHVLHFDSVRDRIVETFLEEIGLGDAGIDVGDQSQPVNRGLTIEEEILLREANAIGGDAYSRTMSDSLLYSFPNRKVTEQVSEALLGMIESRHGADVRWINSTFFGGRPMVSICSEHREADRSPSAEVLAETARHLLSFTLREMQQADERALHNLISKITVQAAPPESDIDESVPTDFDPIRYLLFNVDVLRDGWNAYQHYLVHGRSEGRAYRDL